MPVTAWRMSLTVSDLDLEAQQLLARSVSKTIARSYPPVDADDIEQEVMLWAWSNQDRVRGWSEALFRTKFSEQAVTYARRERQERLHQTDFYYYRPDDVRAILPYFFDSSTWGNIRPPEDDPIIYGAKDSAAPGQVIYHNDKANGLVMVADIDDAWPVLNKTQRTALFLAFIDGPGDAAERKREQRAVDSLTALLNENIRSRPVGPGSRKVMTNAAGQAAIREVA
jgi:DNA-directed RNA polymerase specialized sigma24 family protein